MEKPTVALFGETEKGDYSTPHFCESLPELVDTFGNPPPDTLGLYFAIQTLLFHHHLIFFRVKEEGFSLQDYFDGIKILRRQNLLIDLSAIGLPGLGNKEVIEDVASLCAVYHSLLITSEADLYDYLTEMDL